MAVEVLLSVFALTLISLGTFSLSRITHLPYTVLLVLVGLLLVPLSHLPFLDFLSAFELTPELLFYVFLPILIFESAYNMQIRDLMKNVHTISWFSIVSLLLSMFFIAGALFYLLRFFGMEVPFLVTLLFGALISATDPVAVLALFKEFGVPRRLSFLFEGESLFNDGTALAVFLVVLEICLVGFSGVSSILGGIFTFATMVIGGILFGLFMGFLFTKLISWVNHEHLEITLTLLVAHLTFLLSEVISHHFTLFGVEIRLSSIIATVMASLVIGNYGRAKFSPAVQHFMEPFWSYFAFLANSLVFIAMGILFAELPVSLKELFIPVSLAVLVVIIARAFSIYPVAAWLNFRQKERSIPMTWQHLLSWGSLRGALAIIMVLLIPDTLTLPGWTYDFTIKEFIMGLTIGCIYFTLFIKATTMGAFIRKFKLDALTETQSAEYYQSRIFIFSYVEERLSDLLQKGYVTQGACKKLRDRIGSLKEKDYEACEDILTKKSKYFEEALRLYALGIEKYFLNLLFRYQEISEPVYRKILTKLDIQHERVEEGEKQSHSLHEKFERNWLEQIVLFFYKIFGKKMRPEELLEERYMYYRAQTIIARKVRKEIRLLEERSRLNSEAYQKAIGKVLKTYEDFYEEAERQMKEISHENKEFVSHIDDRFGERSLQKILEEGLQELTRKEMLSPRVALLLAEKAHS